MSHDIARSFAPVARHDARVLILGSIPGRESLRVGQYYAHPRNQFWPIMAALLGFAHDVPYVQRLAGLQSAGIALWDVLDSCERPGSLDAGIQRGSEKVNDFALFFRQHPHVRAVFCNGTKAHAGYNTYVQPEVHGLPTAVRLPSTSPAHASLSFAQKFEAWKVALVPYRQA